MAIVKMKKFNLFVLESNRKQLLEELQKFSYVHFVKTDAKEYAEYLKDTEVSSDTSTYSEQSSKVQWMINYVEKFAEKEKAISALKKGPAVYTFDELEKAAKSYDYEPDYKSLDEISKKLDENKQEILNLQNSIKELKPWEGIKEPIHELRNFKIAKFIMGSVPTKNLLKFKESLATFKYTYFEEQSVTGNSTNCIFFTNEVEYEALMEVFRANGFVESNLDIDCVVGDAILEKENRISVLNEDNLKLTEEVKGFTKNLFNMKLVYEYLENLAIRNGAVSNFKSTERLDVVEGFIPFDKENDFRNTINKISDSKIHIEIEDADRDDPEVPIILKNNKISSLFESVTQMYALPKYNEADPTFLLSIFYWVFFGMMVADFAYGLILLILTGTALTLFKFNESVKKFLQFFCCLSFSTMIWGLLFGSAFGDLIQLPTQVLDSSKDFMTVLIMSIAFGGIHLAFGLGMKAYVLIKNGQPMDAFYDVFLWFLTLASTIVYVLILANVIKASGLGKTITLVAMLVGMLGIIAFGARDSKSMAGRIAGGMYSLYGITGYIGDFVSYLRLMALGLAGGFIAVAINIIVKMLVGAGPVGFVFGGIVFAFGQAFNIFLSFLSAYVHTSRLMYVEFFSKFYEGGGKAFKKFRSKDKYIELR